MSPQFRCRECGEEFSLPEAVLARYPGWTPSACLPCRDRARNGGVAEGSVSVESAAASRSARVRSGATRKSITAVQDLSPEEVLARFHGGPDTGVFTDGSAMPNPGPGGWGVAWVEAGALQGEASGRADQTTNNRMELTALIEAYRMVPQRAGGRVIPVYSDSELCVKTVTEWAPKWERAGWKKKSGPIMNLDLVQELLALARGRPDLALTWTPAHSGWRWNEYADSLASAYRRKT